jgi:hypothetical protein
MVKRLIVVIFTVFGLMCAGCGSSSPGSGTSPAASSGGGGGGGGY